MLGAVRTADDGRWYRLALGTLVLAAWVALALWDTSLHPEALHHEPHVADVHHHHPIEADSGTGGGALPPVSRLLVFLAGWVLMTIAMMLPGTMPLLNLFRRVTAARSDHTRLLLLLGVGYLAAWTVFGAAALLGDVLLHAAVERVGLLAEAAWSIPSIVLLAAGLYQFTPLKEKCLAECRSPYAFLLGSWHGRRPRGEAWRLGARHGIFCVGCCWTLMLLMFAVGVAHLGWMLALGAVMSAERSVSWGRRVTKPVGVLLAVWGLLGLLAGVRG
jgi:predicted metal-binding membrane protein